MKLLEMSTNEAAKIVSKMTLKECVAAFNEMQTAQISVASIFKAAELMTALQSRAKIGAAKYFNADGLQTADYFEAVKNPANLEMLFIAYKVVTFADAPIGTSMKG